MPNPKPAMPIKFTEHQIRDGYNYVFGVTAVDITGNGDLDLVVPDGFVGLYWFENDGRGNFRRHTIYEDSSPLMERHAVADINGDGRPEIVIVDNINGSLLCFEFEGDPRDQGSWRRHYICEGTLPFIYDVTVADFDGDGQLDIAASSYKGNRFAWFQQQNGRWIQHMIEENIGETRTIVAGDINGNGRFDLLATAFLEGQVLWYENPGNPADEPWRKHIIDEAPHPVHGLLADMTGTGSLDVVMALGMRSVEAQTEAVLYQLVWYENNGSPEDGPWQKHIICDSFPAAFEAIAADIDGDGQLEVIATAWGDAGQVALFKHGGDPRGPWTMQVLKENWINANQVIAADIDGDGRLDIIATAERGSNEVRWWHNGGPA